MSGVQECLYLKSISVQSNFSSTTYDDTLCQEIQGLQRSFQSPVASRDAGPIMASEYGVSTILAAFYNQGYVARMSAHRQYLVTCNPHHKALRIHSDMPLMLVCPQQYIMYLAHQYIDNPVTGLLNLILFIAHDQTVTDIHLCNDCQIIMKKNRKHYQTLTVPPNGLQPLKYYIKFNSNLDPNITFRPQDGAIPYSFDSIDLDVRVATLPTQHHEMMSLRIFNANHGPQTLDQLGFSREKIQAIHTMIQNDNGMILITGSTGSGKSTTLYGLLRRMNHRHILTLEDPIEQTISSVHQTQVDDRKGYAIDVGIKAILRHNPDVIAVGEIRDKHTADIAINAAYSGHLVIASLHTNSIDTTLLRLKSLGCSEFLIGYCLRGIITQSLDNRNDQLQLNSAILLCKKPYIMTDIHNQLTDFIKYNILLE